MTRDYAIERLNIIINKSGNDGSYKYNISENVWKNYGKNRTYYKIVRKRANSKNITERPFGYIDNDTGEYYAGKNDLTQNYNFDGAKF
jgi:hypothetical protein